MKYSDYTIKLLNQLGIDRMYRGCEYIITSIEYIHQNGRHFIPDSEILYAHVANEYCTLPVSIENSMRNVIQRIWETKAKPDFMRTIFGEYNMSKRPCNMEFLMLLFNHIKYEMDFENLLDEAQVQQSDK